MKMKILSFSENLNLIILRKDSGKNKGPKILPYGRRTRQLKLGDSSDESLCHSK